MRILYTSVIVKRCQIVISVMALLLSVGAPGHMTTLDRQFVAAAVHENFAPTNRVLDKDPEPNATEKDLTNRDFPVYVLCGYRAPQDNHLRLAAARIDGFSSSASQVGI